MFSINEGVALQDRARERVNELNEYEQRHPGQGPDASGAPYDPVRDVIIGELVDGSTSVRRQIDKVRTATIKSRTWEGFAWANHRFVLSDERGNALIIGYNEDARVWFMDTTTPVQLPREWVEQFVAHFDSDGSITGFEDPREIHDEIVQRVGGMIPTIPSQDEIADYLRLRRAQPVGGR